VELFGGPIGKWKLDYVDFLLLLVNLPSLGVLFAVAVGSFDLIGERADLAADFLERVVERQNAWYQHLVYFAINLADFLRNGLLGRLHLAIELLIVGRGLDLVLKRSLMRPDAAKIARVNLRETPLVRFPGPDSVDLVV